MAKVLYFNIDDTLEYENALLKEWGVTDIELIEIKDKEYKKDFVSHVKDAKADGLVVEYEQVTKEVMDELPDLKTVSLQSIGYNNVDIDAATEHGICVANIPGFWADVVAFWTIVSLFFVVRILRFYIRGGSAVT